MLTLSMKAAHTPHTHEHVPHRLCQGFGGIFRHKDMAGKPVVSRVLSDKPKVPVERRHL